MERHGGHGDQRADVGYGGGILGDEGKGANIIFFTPDVVMRADWHVANKTKAKKANKIETNGNRFV